MINIKFYWNGSFAGTTYSFRIDDGEEIGLSDSISTSEEESKDKIISMMNTVYKIDYNKDDIKFEWGGRL